MKNSETAGVMVTYNPDVKSLIENIKQASMQLQKIFIVNNSDYRLLIPQDLPNIEVINLGHNFGIAYAQNVGMKRVITEGFQFILQLDQDTFIPDYYVEKVSTLYRELVAGGLKVGVVGASIFDRHTNSLLTPLLSSQTTSGRYALVTDILSSGSFIPVATIKAAGFMDEALFIDLVDFEFCWRVSSKGLHIVRHNEAIIVHQLGEGRMKILGKSLIGVPSPFRHYFQFRNSMFLILNNRTTKYWALKSVIKMLLKITLYPFILPQGVQRLKYMIHGLKDGLSGTLGPIGKNKTK